MDITKKTALLWGLLLSITGYSQEFKYAAPLIPDSLKENAFAVIRDHNLNVEIVSLTEILIKEKKVITVLNENGKTFAWDYIFYDSNSDIKSIKVIVYNEFGIKVETFSRKDLDDISADPYGTTYSDSRYLVSKPIRNSYPYTVEYLVTYEKNNSYGLPNWFPVYDDNLSIEKSAFTVTHFDNFEITYREKNVQPVAIAQSELRKIYSWKLENYKATKYEPFRPFEEEYLPGVSLSATIFKYNEFMGGADSWKNFGAFRIQLMKDKWQLPELKKAEIKAIIDTCTSTESKIYSLYKYMQSHTRYVSIQEGIGGIQPFSAITVANTGYGDCKALSNYMLAILKQVGINSYYTVIKAGDNNYYFDKDFIGHQSNHAILCVPIENDTIWLECTSQTMPAGYLGKFTDNRIVLLITEDGGVLAKTPEYKKEQNLIARKAVVNVLENGNCIANLNSSFYGLEYDEVHRIAIEDREEQLKLIYEHLNIPNFKVQDFHTESKGTRNPVLNTSIDLELASYASKSGTRLFIPLNLASKWSFVPKKLDERKYDIHKKYAACYSDTVTYKLPDNYRVEVIPEITGIDNEFGIYSASAKVIDNEIIYIRKLEINKGIFDADAYNDYISFFEQIKKNDESMAVLKRAK